MLQKTILDEGPALSGRMALHWQFRSSHGVVNYQDLTSLRLNGQFSSTCRLRSTTYFGDRLIQLLSKPKGNIRKFIFLAEIQGENESNSWKLSACNGTPNAAIHNSVTNLYHENAFVRSGDSCHKSEEGSDCLSLHRQGLSEPVSHLLNLLDKLKAVHLLLLASEHWNASQLKSCHRIYLASAKNLTHYLALQGLDIQQLKDELFSVGLLNLESINSYILASINAGILLMENLVSKDPRSKDITCYMEGRGYSIVQESENLGEFTINTMKKRASSHAAALFGPSQGKKTVHIMVTVGREAISNEILLTNLLKAGANVIRINCAHDGPNVWSEIIRIAKYSSQLLEKPCRILMDLAGPKLRTGLLMTDQNMMKISPKKDDKGEIIFPAQVWLCCPGSSPPADLSAGTIICVEQKFLDKLKAGNVIRFVDVRGKKRSLKLPRKSSLITDSGYMVECSRTAYIGLDTKLHVRKKNKKPLIGQVLNMPTVEQSIMLKVGDLIIISRDYCLSMGELISTTFVSTRITCSSDQLFDCVKPGEPIAFDDGKIWGEIREKNIGGITVLITHAIPNGSKLESGKSINIPESEVLIKGLTSKDLEDLDFVAANADMVGISFIRDVSDVVRVQNELEKRMLQKLGIVLKIETREAFEKLPLLLFQAMQSSNPLGVMIARGDLMVECGWDKMAHIQEEILSICNAAQVPVIWATRVLESLIKYGIPTRAEITDVVSGTRANCVMLNKGEHIVEAVSALDSILRNSTRKNMKTLVDPRSPSSCLNQ